MAFSADFTRENRGAHAVVEVLGPDVGYNVQTEDRPFDGIAADVKDGEDTVWITFGSTPAIISRMGYTMSQPSGCGRRQDSKGTLS
jgi:hypothetical protein